MRSFIRFNYPDHSDNPYVNRHFGNPPRHKKPCQPKHHEFNTTLAIGEEGGASHFGGGQIVTQALHENGGKDHFGSSYHTERNITQAYGVNEGGF